MCGPLSAYWLLGMAMVVAMDIEGEPIVKFFRELQKVKDDHRSLVLVANGIMELFVETLVKARCKNSKRITADSRGYPYSAKLLLLNECGVIEDSWYRLLDKFRKLRNRAAHEPFFSVITSDLQHIKDERLSQVENFADLCTQMLVGFWNTHLDVFGPEFAPKITTGAKANKGIQPDKPGSGGPAS